MKRKLSVLLVLMLLAAAILGGCGGEKTGDAGQAGSGESAEPVIAGFIYVGPANDGGYSQAHDNGRKYLEEALGDKVKTLYQEGVAENMEAVTATAKTMIDEGADIIFTTSFGFMDATEQLAAEFPEVKFMHCSGYKKNDTNFGNYFGAMEQPRYLSGIVAGLKTKTNKIGYVGAFPLTELKIGINAFTLGAQSVNPDVSVNVVWTNSWHDPAKEREAADALLDQGCDVIAQHCDTTGPQVAAQEKGAWTVGYNADTASVAPDAFMTAPVWNHGVFYTAQVQKVIDGTWQPESYYGNIADGYVDLLPLTAIAPEGAAAKVEEAKARFVSGESVFVGPIYDQKGDKVVEDGVALTREDIWGGATEMKYLVKGVVGSAE